MPPAEAGRASRVYAAAGCSGLTVRFLALEPDAVLLHWPQQGTRAIGARDAAVEVCFQHGGRVLGFRTTTCGRVEYTRAKSGTIAAWKLALPLCVEARQQRRTCA
jgi:hypothetical protein